MNAFEVVGVVTGILGVWLTTRQKIWCWPVGLVSVIAFIVVFFEAKLYAAMGLQAVYVVLLVYGWYAWLHGGADHGELRVSRVPGRILMPLAVAGVASTALLGVWILPRTDESLPLLDAFTMSFSLVAQWMQTRKHLENWGLWMVVDLVYVGMTLTQGLRLTAGLYFIYIILAVLGYRDWRRSMAAAGEPA
jgi:nicotinamide mononucleotide transporter